MKWFKEGYANINFFHSIMNVKRSKMTFKKMKKEDNTQVEGNEDIASEAIIVFDKQFTDPGSKQT